MCLVPWYMVCPVRPMMLLVSILSILEVSAHSPRTSDSKWCCWDHGKSSCAFECVSIHVQSLDRGIYFRPPPSPITEEDVIETVGKKKVPQSVRSRLELPF